MLNSVVARVTRNLEERSVKGREAYLKMIADQEKLGRARSFLTCSNLAHAAAGTDLQDKKDVVNASKANIGIVSAYNDMLSAHCPYRLYPEAIKQSVRKAGATAQVAGCVPAMCDGVTQGQAGMDMSLFSRDVIAQSVAISLSHNCFDGALLLGICDKVAPGMIMGAAAFGHLPVAFVPAGPMGTGISNDKKTEIRQQYAAGKLDKTALQDMECCSYHSQGTCTFYGTANTNQLVFEAMGLMLPGSAFIPPDTQLRQALTDHISSAIVDRTVTGTSPMPLYRVVTAKNIINSLCALLASGGSTNHTLHLVAVARAFGYTLTWQDISDLSEAVPLLVNVYPNAKADINAFQMAGGVPVLMKSLSRRNLVHEDINTVTGDFASQLTSPVIKDDELVFVDCGETHDESVLKSSADESFQQSGGLRVLNGNLGRSVIKISAVAPEHRHVKAPAAVFNDQYEVKKAYEEGRLNRDAVIVVRYAGPAASGMPELHMLMPVLGNLQKAGYHVALLTDGRLSGASGKIPSALHVSPEALRGGPLSLLRDGDMIDFDAENGTVNCLEDLSGRTAVHPDTEAAEQTFGRYLFKNCRNSVGSAEEGASFLF